MKSPREQPYFYSNLVLADVGFFGGESGEDDFWQVYDNPTVD